MIDFDDESIVTKDSSPLSTSDEDIRHRISLARKCYDLAEQNKLPGVLCGVMYSLGVFYSDDLDFIYFKNGYFENFCNKLRLLIISVYNITDISNSKSYIESILSICINIILEADLTASQSGNNISCRERLEELSAIYGKESSKYLHLEKVAIELGLLNK